MEHTALAAWRQLGLTSDDEDDLAELEGIAQNMAAAVSWRSVQDAREALAHIILQERGVQPSTNMI